MIAFSHRQAAQDYFDLGQADIALLDIALNDEREGGFQLCAYLRHKIPTLPIIFLTSHHSEIDKISGLRLGADDHLSKDVSMDFLMIRIEALLRRFQGLHQTISTSLSKQQIHHSRLRVLNLTQLSPILFMHNSSSPFSVRKSTEHAGQPSLRWS